MNQATARKIQRIQSYNAEDTSTIILESRKQIQEIVVLAYKYKFFAMDCEWVPQPNHKKIALIQLSFPNGKCFLLRAHKVDREILKLLQDTDVIKIGLGHLERDKDYGRLQSQYNISPVGLVDIRHFVKELDPNYPNCGRETSYGLQALAKHYLNVTNYFDYFEHHEWEDDPLEEYQVIYAANDVLTIMAICLKITFNECHPWADFDKLVSLARNEGLQWIDQQFNQFSPQRPIVYDRDDTIQCSVRAGSRQGS